MRRILLSLAGLLTITALMAKDPADSLELLKEQIRVIDSIESTFHYKTGKVQLGAGIATIDVPAGFKFLESGEAKYVIEDIWGNPPSKEAPLGILLPPNVNATDAGGYAFIVSYEALGHVKDGDADKINYDDLLKDLKKSSTEENIERKKQNIFTMDLIGWAAKPYYDPQRKVLHWAKEYSIPGMEQNTLNYDVRVLGRKGVLVLQAVSQMDMLDSVNSHLGEVLGMVSFTSGNQYAEFDSKTDDVAAWTIGGLVAGKVLAKVGFFAVILKFLKFIIAGVVVIGGVIWRFITGRKKQEPEPVYQPAPVQDHPTDTNIPS